MSDEKTNESDNDLQVENNQQSSLSNKPSRQVNKKISGSTSKRYKLLLTCTVCDGDAHGYNFDAMTCESCKAFFRRNASRSSGKFKCRGNHHCDVRFNIKRRCKRCRLEKCFQTGMRKEWILSDKEKEEKRAKIEQNRRLKQIHDNNADCKIFIKWESKTDDSLSLDFLSIPNRSVLTDVDRFTIHSIQNSYSEAVKLNQIAGISQYPSTEPIESTLDLFRVPLYISSMRLISYIKQVKEFQQLNTKDQVHVVKLNLLTICFFRSIFIYDPITDNYHEPDTSDQLFSRKDWIKTLNTQFHSQMKQFRNDLIDIFQFDDIIIKLFFLILLFSNQMSLNQSDQCLFNDIHVLNIFKAQNVFTDLVYKYCLHQYGSSKAVVLFSRYVNKIIQIQLLVDEIKHDIHNYMDTTQISALMQSLLD